MKVMGSHLTKLVPVQSYNSFLVETSSCDFTGTIFVQCKNPVIAHMFGHKILGTSQEPQHAFVKHS